MIFYNFREEFDTAILLNLHLLRNYLLGASISILLQKFHPIPLQMIFNGTIRRYASSISDQIIRNILQIHGSLKVGLNQICFQQN